MDEAVDDAAADGAARAALEGVVVVLWQTQDYVNIAGTVRAMKNFGLSRLRLIQPVEYDPWRIQGIAHGTEDVVQRIESHDSLLSALGDCSYVVGMTARSRRAKRAVGRPRSLAPELLGRAAEAVAGQAGPVALLFGREDHGLPNDALDRAHLMVTIPTSTHASINLAQAVLVALYELHLAAGDATRTVGRWRKHAGPAPAQASEEYFRDAERALVALDFFKTRNPEHVMRSVRSLTYRAAPDARELGLMRAMAFEVLRTVEREAARARAEGYAAGLDAGRAAADV